MFMGAGHALTIAAVDLLQAAVDQGHDDPLKAAQQALLDVAYEAQLVHVDKPKPTATPRRQISRKVQRDVWGHDGWRCTLCGDNRDLTVDHITPLARGGAMTDMSNLQTLCMRCNRKKGVN